MKFIIFVSCLIAAASAWKHAWKGLGGWDPEICCYPVPPQCCPDPCPRCLDVPIMMDVSSSIGDLDFLKQLDFLTSFSNSFTIGPMDFQTALVTFGGTSVLEWNLGAHANNAELMTSIAGLTQAGGFTDTAGAIQLTLDAVIGSPGDRADCENSCIVITDGLSNTGAAGLALVVPQLHAMCRETYVVAVTHDLDPGQIIPFNDEIRMIASSEDNIFEVTDFDGLAGALDGLVDEICKDFVGDEVDGCCPYDYENMYYHH